MTLVSKMIPEKKKKTILCCIYVIFYQPDEITWFCSVLVIPMKPLP